MLDIIGGSYFEFCREPYWSQLYGSGGRAAAAISKLCSQVRLHSFAAPDSLESLETLSRTYGFELRPTASEVTPRFSYCHGLSIPEITPHPSTFKPAPTITVKCKNALQFGMLEGESIVHGDSVVYDPQSPQAPKRFDLKGSTAKRLAIVVNRSEGRMLTGKEEPESIGRALLRSHGAAVAIIKMGAHGALVCERKRSTRIHAYKTPFVFPIGSGDVFSAVFANFWAHDKKSAAWAAQMASLSAARYCASLVLPIPRDRSVPDEFEEISARKLNRKPRTVYLAGPFFDLAQRWLVNESRNALLSAGLGVFSPFHDVGMGSSMDVAPADIDALEKCDAVFALVDGLDAGTLFEIGYARALKKPVVVLCQREAEEPMKMIDGTGCTITKDFVTGIYKTVWSTL